MIKIYCLLDPTTHEIRYVGITKSTLQARLVGHMKDSRRINSRNGNTYKSNWIRSLAKQPLIELLQEVHIEYWQDAERYWIKYFRELGCRLTNTTLGGDGVACTPEIKVKISNKIKILMQDSAYRDKVFANHSAHCVKYSYEVTAPDGTVHVLKGLNQFCKDHNLNNSMMYQVANGRFKEYKGYKCIKLSL